jgi:predicted NAD/FAD-binding protein
VPLVVLGAFLVPAYNLELLGGRVHTDLGFGLAWGAFPVVTAYVAQTGTLRWEAALAAGWATLLSLAQRRLSRLARRVRRDVVSVDGLLVNADGTSEPLDRAAIAAAPEAALRLLTASTLAIAAALLALRL